LPGKFLEGAAAGGDCVFKVLSFIRTLAQQFKFVTEIVLDPTPNLQLASIPLFVSVACLLAGEHVAMYWLVLGFIFSFVAGVGNGWFLLVEVVR
jgi:uncharacterized membrane protein